MAKSPKIVMTDLMQKCMIGAVLLFMYAPTFIWMWDRWFARDSYYSHGILIPLVSIFLIWQKRDALKKIKCESSHWGMKLFFLGIAIHLLSALFRVYFTSGFSIIIVLYGLILHFYGTKLFNDVLFLVSLLFFMIALPLVDITNLSFSLKIFAAQISVHVLNQMHMPCTQQGSAIIMRHAYVVVDDVCSGLRSLITLMALGSLFAYWMKSTVIKKTILFLTTIPIAVLTNVMRIVFLAFVSEVWGGKVASGHLHDISGFIVFTGAFCLLYLAQKMIE